MALGSVVKRHVRRMRASCRGTHCRRCMQPMQEAVPSPLRQVGVGTRGPLGSGNALDLNPLADFALSGGTVERRENVALSGRTGVSKSHIGQTLGRRARMADYVELYLGPRHAATALCRTNRRGPRPQAPPLTSRPIRSISTTEACAHSKDDEPIDLDELIRAATSTAR